MDRGGGRGHGGPSRHGSSLPRTLHGSLLHTVPQDSEGAPTDEPQPLDTAEGGQEEDIPYTTYSTSSARPAPAPYSSTAPPLPPTFEIGSSRDVGGPPTGLPPPGIDRPAEQTLQPRGRNQTPHLYLPPFRQGIGSTDPVLYASSVGGTASTSSTTFYSYPPPAAPARLPPVRSLERGLAPSSSSLPGPSSSQYYGYGQARQWPYPTQEVFPERTTQRQPWEVPAPQDDPSFGRTYGGPYEPGGLADTERWMQVGRQENFPQEEERSTAAHRRFL